ncbi:hypothetical protein V6N13_023184 [Hibiscus sabdariffa]
MPSLFFTPFLALHCRAIAQIFLLNLCTMRSNSGSYGQIPSIVLLKRYFTNFSIVTSFQSKAKEFYTHIQKVDDQKIYVLACVVPFFVEAINAHFGLLPHDTNTYAAFGSASTYETYEQVLCVCSAARHCLRFRVHRTTIPDYCGVASFPNELFGVDDVAHDAKCQPSLPPSEAVLVALPSTQNMTIL